LKQKPEAEQLTIDQRLANWGHCQRGRTGGSMSARETRRSSPYGGQGYRCMTAVVCTLMREATSGPTGGPSAQARLDFADAARVHAAWMTLDPRTKLLLRDFYVLNTQPHVICRALNIRHWPGSHWLRELRSAQDAIQLIVEKREGTQE
jgi:hypothetical protein